MKPTATDQMMMIAVSPCALNPDDLQERFRVRPAPDIDERAYRVTTLKNEHEYIVLFGRTPTGAAIAGCTCPDFQFKSHVCKHIKACAPLHRWRMRQQSEDARFMPSHALRERLIEDWRSGRIVDITPRLNELLERHAAEVAEACAARYRQFERRMKNDLNRTEE